MQLKQKNTNMSIDYLYKIIIQNNIKFGHSQYLRCKDTNLFIFQTKEFEKERIEFFNKIDLKHILYRIYLYIQTLYAVNSKQNNFLFATTTAAYSEILTNAALSTNSVFHTDRWTCGMLTRKDLAIGNESEYIDGHNRFRKKNIFNFCNYFLRFETGAGEIPGKGFMTYPLIAVFIPDPQNNLMIVREARYENIPLIGIINSDCNINLDYPIFGNNQSLFSVFFFSNLISHWIHTHMEVYMEKKVYIFQRKKRLKIQKSLADLRQDKYFTFFHKRYIVMLYKFHKSFKKDISYNVFMNQSDSINIDNYQKKLKQQQRTRLLENNLFFSSTNIWSLTTRWAVLSQTLQSNLAGGVSFTNAFFGNRFWLYFRNFLNSRKPQQRNKFLRIFKWSKKALFHWKWKFIGKKKILKKNKGFWSIKRKNKRAYTKKNIISKLTNKTYSKKRIHSVTKKSYYVKINEKKYNLKFKKKK